ncbi:MAG: hypothetical protein K0U54_03365 [Bacteroidetes bacterium]|nr:hypothetical protein [Bacteroidota bacterium]
MAPIKFEENIREKLQERELQPSSDAWSALANKMDELPQKKRPSLLWMAVAASVVGILLVVGFLFNEDTNVSNQLVEEDTIHNNEEFIVPMEENNIMDQVIAEEPKVEENERRFEETVKKMGEESIPVNMNPEVAMETPKELVENVRKSLIVNNSDEVDIVMKTQEAVVKTNTEKNVVIDPVIGGENEFIQQKIEEVVAGVKELQEENNTITEAEIDALLTKAQSDIATNRILHSGTAKVDATALLQDVETELEQSFRNKVYEALGEGFNKVRTAVVERNN